MSSERINSKLEELRLLKESLIPLSEFKKEDNQRVFYSKEALSDKDMYHGVTALDLGMCLQTISDSILEYVEALKTLDYKKVSPIQNNRKSVEFASSTRYGKEYPNLSKNGSNLLMGDLIASGIKRVNSGIESMTVSSSSRIFSPEGENVSLNTVLLKINAISSTVDRFFSSTGDIEVSFAGKDVSVFDVFVIGIEIKDNINPNIGYNMDTSFKISKKMKDGLTKVENGTIGDKKIGIQNIILDENNPYGVSIFSILGHRGMQIGITDSISNKYSIDIGNSPYTTNTSSNGNILSEISVLGKAINLSQNNISMWANNSTVKDYIEDTYDTYIDDSATQDSVIFKNVAPISETIKRALNEL